MRRIRRGLFVAALVALVVGVGAATGTGSQSAGGKGGHGGHHAKKPTRVLIVLFDQMRPEYADRFDMTNFKRLRDKGTNFKNAYLGYMGSETVISHNVIVSGLHPKHMGWVDEAYRDTENLLGGGAGNMWVTGDLTLAQFDTLVANEEYPKLADYLHAAFPGTKFIAVGEKSYAVESAVAPTGDIGVRLSGRQADTSAATGCANLNGRWRYPFGKNVPTYSDRAEVRALLHQLRRHQRLHDAHDPAGVDVPGGRQPLPAGQRPRAPRRRHVGGRRGDGDDGERELVGHVRHPRRDRQGRPHVGRRPGRPVAARIARLPDPRGVHGQERRRPARPDACQAQGAGTAR